MSIEKIKGVAELAIISGSGMPNLLSEVRIIDIFKRVSKTYAFKSVWDLLSKNGFTLLLLILRSFLIGILISWVNIWEVEVAKNNQTICSKLIS